MNRYRTINTIDCRVVWTRVSDGIREFPARIWKHFIEWYRKRPSQIRHKQTECLHKKKWSNIVNWNGYAFQKIINYCETSSTLCLAIDDDPAPTEAAFVALQNAKSLTELTSNAIGNRTDVIAIKLAVSRMALKVESNKEVSQLPENLAVL